MLLLHVAESKGLIKQSDKELGTFSPSDKEFVMTYLSKLFKISI